MSYKTVKAKWAVKLAKAKYFVVLTDKESVIAFEGVRPDTMTDTVALAAQTSELKMFQSQLNRLVKDHEKAVEKLGGSDATVKGKPVSKKASK